MTLPAPTPSIKKAMSTRVSGFIKLRGGHQDWGCTGEGGTQSSSEGFVFYSVFHPTLEIRDGFQREEETKLHQRRGKIISLTHL